MGKVTRTRRRRRRAQEPADPADFGIVHAGREGFSGADDEGTGGADASDGTQGPVVGEAAARLVELGDKAAANETAAEPDAAAAPQADAPAAPVERVADEGLKRMMAQAVKGLGNSICRRAKVDLLDEQETTELGDGLAALFVALGWDVQAPPWLSATVAIGFTSYAIIDRRFDQYLAAHKPADIPKSDGPPMVDVSHVIGGAS